MPNYEIVVGFQNLGIKKQEKDISVFSVFSDLNEEDRGIVNKIGIDNILSSENDNLIEKRRRWGDENPFNRLNNQVTVLVKGELKSGYRDIINENFYKVLGKKEKKVNLAIECLVGAKISALKAVINQSNDFKKSVGYGVQSISYLKDLGIDFFMAEKTGKEFHQNISKGLYKDEENEVFDKKMLEILGVR